MARKADSLGAQLSMECLPRACLGNTSQEVLRLIDGIMTIGVTLDMNHLLPGEAGGFVTIFPGRVRPCAYRAA